MGKAWATIVVLAILVAASTFTTPGRAVLAHFGLAKACANAGCGD